MPITQVNGKESKGIVLDGINGMSILINIYK